MPRVIFITVEISTNHPWLDEKMLQVTEASQYQLSEGNYPVVVIKDYNEINKYLDQADWLFVETAGDIVINRDHLWDKIHTDLQDDVGIMGHIIWYPEDSLPHLHKQCFIINTRAFSRGIKFNEYQSYGPKFIRGQGDMNCGHAPLSVSLTDSYEERQMTFGSAAMEEALTKGFRVINFNEDWRYPPSNLKFISIDDIVDRLDLDKSRFRLPARGYFYPEIQPELFESALKSLTVNDDLEETQKLVISMIRKALEFNYFNAWHWDCHPPHIQTDIVISPANGLLGESMAYTSGAKKIIFYDLNHNNLEFKKLLYSEWNGKNYQEFVEKFSKEKNLSIEPQLDSAQSESEKYQELNKKILDNWYHFKNLEIEYQNCDLISSIDNLLPRDGCAFIHTSTILNYFLISNILHSKEKINQVRSLIDKFCQKTNSHWVEST